jgi:hypothetical protein
MTRTKTLIKTLNKLFSTRFLRMALFSGIIWITFTFFLSSENINIINLFQINSGLNLPLDKCGYGPKGPRILCVALTYPNNYKTKAKAVAETWGPRCDKFYFATGADKNETPPELSAVNMIYLNASNRYNDLSNKMFRLFEYIYDNLIDEFDWFLKADDDTYVIVENLKYLLANKCQDDKHSYGLFINKVYNSILFDFNILELKGLNAKKSINHFVIIFL